MTDNLKKFFEFVANDPELLEKAKQLKVEDTEKAKEIAIAFAKENGFELTEADFEAPEGELSESELSGLAGGGECFCFVGGGGTKDDRDGVCACVLAGGGEDSVGRTRCTCIGGGSGE